MNPTASMSAVSPNLAIVDGRPVTTSLNVAEVFGKQHQHVLRAIDRLEVPGEFAASNFGRGSYLDANNQPRPMYQITRDGFTLLAMGFTGKAAMQFKLAYISAFNAMENELLEQAAGGSRKTVDFNYYRRTPSPSGLDIRYTLDLTKIIMRPSAKSLVVLERLTGIDCSDLAEEGTEEMGAVHLFVSECLRGCPGQRVSLADVYSGYRVWFRESRLPAANKIHALKTLSSSLRQSGFEVIKLGGRTWVMDTSLTLEVQA